MKKNVVRKLWFWKMMKRRKKLYWKNIYKKNFVMKFCLNYNIFWSKVKKLKLWQNYKNSNCDKTQIVTPKNSNCDKTQQLKLWLNSKTQIVTKINRSQIELKLWKKKLNNLKYDLIQKLKLWQNSKTKVVTKIKLW